MEIDDDKDLIEQQDRDKRLAIRESEDLKWMMSHPEGRRRMYKLLSRCHMFAGGYRHTNEMMFCEGERNIGILHYAEIIQNDLEDLYFKMLKEAKEPV